MTRIVAGTAGGRRLRVPPAGTRPTSDRVREALFSVLHARMDFEGLHVLDLYAGSGALALEALSRGASHALMIEADRKAAAIIRGNIGDLGLPGAELRHNSVASVLTGTPPERYDLVFSDPPYDLDVAQVESDLRALADNGWLHDDALIVVERSTRSPALTWPKPFSPLKSRSYGETRIDLAEFEA
ncbi:16S rRNA (guanine(966)-N(2))-methyltransferase RsmD [Nocardia yunnanensis]|uniref:16S rRNA (Guanine(966)-N(2))-methyltransferase RsmD n=1 Tax=Nocardia yunnanensis TaxID=2382165 RepID=A0A386ZDC5_9NOCA|nr:16S rRNA (guanine(966)-N(2))-methyltransferase RsmD [Nocardia yunnanensis]AYF75183.1 16S rRNA (guanine(966)-N(2))-methyltransferase RsmD [Nocardia yunnanensis]